MKPLVLTLDGEWTARPLSGDGAELPARVPGTIHEDLLRAGRIGDPFHRDQELSLQWIGETAWLYRRTFQLPAGFRERADIRLECDGLDTLATIRVNGREIGRTDNMFRRWSHAVAAALRDGENVIEIEFAETLTPLRDKDSVYKAAGRNLYRHRFAPHAPDVPVGALRKMICNYGWDWGPVLVTCGIWRSIRLVAPDPARLRGAVVEQHHSPGRVVLAVTPAFEDLRPASAAAPLRARARLLDAAGSLVAEAAGPAGEACSLTVEQPRLWWPQGLGEPYLHTLEVELLAPASDSSRPAGDAPVEALDTWRRPVGLREIRLRRLRDDRGETFGFTVNGKPFFARGSNWVPPDALYSRATSADYERLLRSAVDGHQNMIRIWGGGLDEQDCFYDHCDRLGLLVWHDFGFACSHAPLFDEAYVANVLAEVRDRLERLRHHACIALWCGNNELEMGGVNDPGDPTAMWWPEYTRLFDEQIAALVRTLSPGTDYWPSSPTTPLGDRRRYNLATSGDAHLWQVWGTGFPARFHRLCDHRFISEFGLQSWAHPRTLDEVLAPADRDPESPVARHHQRAGDGNRRIADYTRELFLPPDSWEGTVWLSQFAQADGLGLAVRYWRSRYPLTEGALYWQLNDTWPAASWSSVDHRGRWKAAHHVLKRAFAPFALETRVREERVVDVHLLRDPGAAAAGTLRWTWWSCAGQKLASGLSETTVSGACARLASLDTAPLLADTAPYKLVLQLVWTAADGTRVSEGVTLLEPKHTWLEDPTPRLTAQGDRVEVTVSKPAFWLWVEDAEARGIFTDNFTACFPDEPFVARAHRTIDDRPLAADPGFRARTLWDVMSAKGRNRYVLVW